MFNTLNANHAFVRRPLDHVFHSSHFTLPDIQRLPSIGSDHFPLLVKLTLNAQHSAQQPGADAVETEPEWAKEIARELDVDKKDVPTPRETHQKLGLHGLALSLLRR